MRARVGFVSWVSPSETGQIEPLRASLRELGWLEGRNLELEAHFAQGSEECVRQALRSMQNRRFDVIVVRATNVAHIAKELIKTLPVVMIVSDPLATGLVRSLARPEANLTGFSLQSPELAGKRLEYLRMLLPHARKVAFLGAADDQNLPNFIRETQAAAARFDIELQVRAVPGVSKYSERDFAELAASGAQAVLVQPIFTVNRDEIVTLAMRHRLPTISDYAAFAKSGALLTLGPDDVALTRRAGHFVDRLLKGANVSDLPVEQPSRFTLALNLATAKTLGLQVPSSLRTLADAVFE